MSVSLRAHHSFSALAPRSGLTKATDAGPSYDRRRSRSPDACYHDDPSSPVQGRPRCPGHRVIMSSCLHLPSLPLSPAREPNDPVLWEMSTRAQGSSRCDKHPRFEPIWGCRDFMWVHETCVVINPPRVRSRVCHGRPTHPVIRGDRREATGEGRSSRSPFAPYPRSSVLVPSLRMQCPAARIIRRMGHPSSVLGNDRTDTPNTDFSRAIAQCPLPRRKADDPPAMLAGRVRLYRERFPPHHGFSLLYLRPRSSTHGTLRPVG